MGFALMFKTLRTVPVCGKTNKFSFDRNNPIAANKLLAIDTVNRKVGPKTEKQIGLALFIAKKVIKALKKIGFLSIGEISGDFLGWAFF